MPPDPSRERISKSPSLVPLMSLKCTFGADCKKLERASLSEERRDSTSPRSEWSLEQALSRNAGRCSGASSKASSSTAFTCCQRSGVMFSPYFAEQGENLATQVIVTGSRAIHVGELGLGIES